MITFLLFTIFTSASLFAQMDTVDPYESKLQRFTHTIRIRLLYHGTKKQNDLMAQQIQAAQNIYSQCGIKLKVEVDSLEFHPSSRFQEKITTVVDRSVALTAEGLEAMKPFMSGKKNGVLDVHIVQHLNKDIRINETTRNQNVNLGVAFNPVLLEWIYKDLRQDKTPPVGEIFGNSLFIAAGTLKLKKELSQDFTIYRDRNQKRYQRNLSLLAHELGHILLEGQTKANTNNQFKDHYCESISASCSRGNLMSGGGNEDAVVTDLTSGEVIGYDPLPELDARQCQLLKNHVLLKAIF